MPFAIAGTAIIAVAAAAAVTVGQRGTVGGGLALHAPVRAAPLTKSDAQTRLAMAAVLAEHPPKPPQDARDTAFRGSQPTLVAEPAAATQGEAAREVRVQIAAAPSEAAARDSWDKPARRFPDAAQGKSIVLEPVQSSGRVLQRVLVTGFADQHAAEAFCRTLRDAGGGCLLRKAAAPSAGVSRTPAAIPSPRGEPMQVAAGDG